MTEFPIIPIDVFSIDVCVFFDDEARVSVLTEEGCGAEPYNEFSLSSAHIDETEGGERRFSLVIKSGATRPIWAHECCHMADFICDYLGIPISVEATEVRAYLVGHMMAGLEEIFQKHAPQATRFGGRT